MEIGQYLVLSTAHIRCATGQCLADWSSLPAERQPLPVAATPHGWFLATYEVTGRASCGLPDELPPILALGRKNGCDYILLDCDGPVESALPIFPW
jgi:hypothetical protein